MVAFESLEIVASNFASSFGPKMYFLAKTLPSCFVTAIFHHFKNLEEEIFAIWSSNLTNVTKLSEPCLCQLTCTQHWPLGQDRALKKLDRVFSDEKPPGEQINLMKDPHFQMPRLTIKFVQATR